MSAGLEFAVVGAEHAGTGTLAELLGGHPGLGLSGPDEAPAFTHTHIHRRRPGRGLRRAQAPADAARVRGTVNPAYTRGWHDTTTATVAARIADAFPDLKLVMLLRDPVERARRQHAAACARGRETRSFDEAARQQLTTDGLSEGRFLPDDTNTYVAQGEYGRILGEYLRHFPRAAVCVEATSTLEGDPSGLLRRVLEFLGVSADHRPEYRPAPSRVPLAGVDADVHDMLAEHYAADAELLRALVGLEVPWRAAGGEPRRRRRAVYTAVAGGRETLEDPRVVSPECDHVCFTDDPYLRSDVWRLRPLERLADDAVPAAHRARALPDRYLPEYETSTWVDADSDVVDRRIASIRDEIETAHTVVVSFPKAGRSWVCYFLARYVVARTGGPVDLDLLAGGNEIPPVAVVHEHMDVFGEAPAPTRLVAEDLLRQRRIVVLVRDPRDSLVSYWHQKRVRERRSVPARLDLFADCPVYGIERVSQGTALLLDLHDRHPGEKLLVAYEDLVADPGRRLAAILRFALDGRPLDERCCREALEASRFERMREWERSLTPDEARTRYQGRFGRREDGPTDDVQFKVRRGEVGAFTTEMSPDLHRHVRELPHTAALLERLAALRGRADPSSTRRPAPRRGPSLSPR